MCLYSPKKLADYVGEHRAVGDSGLIEETIHRYIVSEQAAAHGIDQRRANRVMSSFREAMTTPQPAGVLLSNASFQLVALYGKFNYDGLESV